MIHRHCYTYCMQVSISACLRVCVSIVVCKYNGYESMTNAKKVQEVGTSLVSTEFQNCIQDAVINSNNTKWTTLALSLTHRGCLSGSGRTIGSWSSSPPLPHPAKRTARKAPGQERSGDCPEDALRIPWGPWLRYGYGSILWQPNEHALNDQMTDSIGASIVLFGWSKVLWATKHRPN